MSRWQTNRGILRNSSVKLALATVSTRTLESRIKARRIPPGIEIAIVVTASRMVSSVPSISALALRQTTDQSKFMIDPDAQTARRRYPQRGSLEIE
jgi:hypothetical protein